MRTETEHTIYLKDYAPTPYRIVTVELDFKILEEKKIKDPNLIDKSLQLIMKLDKEGLLESFILLAMSDEGIAQDFNSYRRTNVENLRRYVKDYVLTGGAGPKK